MSLFFRYCIINNTATYKFSFDTLNRLSEPNGLNLNRFPTLMPQQPTPMSLILFPTLTRRLSAAFYESAMVFGIYFLPAYLYLSLSNTRFEDLQQGGLRTWLYQFFIFMVFAVYFGWSWSQGRRTLAQKTWGLRIVNVDGSALSQQRATLRYTLAWCSLLFGFAGFLYAFLNTERVFLHDKLLGTRIVLDETGAAYNNQGR
jgi:uncharacterized RDD family membrane protein YckC